MDSLCSLNFYMKCKIFRNDDRFSLEDEINRFIRFKKNVRISITASEMGLSFYYTAIVYWEE